MVVFQSRRWHIRICTVIGLILHKDWFGFQHKVVAAMKRTLGDQQRSGRVSCLWSDFLKCEIFSKMGDEVTVI